MTLKLSIPSALLGTLLAAVAFLAVGAHSISVTPLIPVVTVSGIPMPQQMMRVIEGQPFAVPHGKILVVTGAANYGAGETGALLTIDGQIVATPLVSGTPIAIPPGLTAKGGQVVAIDDTQPAGTGILLAYLADAWQ